MDGTFEIKNLSMLKDDASALMDEAVNLGGIVQQLKSLSNSVRTNWDSVSGADVMSYLEKIDKCVNNLSDSLLPAIEQYSSTLIELVESTGSIQSTVYEDVSVDEG